MPPVPRPNLPRLAVLGCGNMGGAILHALLRAEPRTIASAVACDPDAEKLRSFEGATPEPDPAAAVAGADVVLVAVKPQVLADVLASVSCVAAGRLFVSVAAGTTTDTLERLLPGGRVVRTMPNTPLLVGRGVVAVCPGRSANADDAKIARSLFAGSLVVDLPEAQMDAATALHGSGPAYVFRLTEALAAAGAAAGLDPDVAARLARETVIGAAALLEADDASPAELRRRVTSPGGTTAAALTQLDDAGFDAVVRDAVLAATRRGHQLALDS